jgi:4-hydroxyphenylacetate 3-monooxygenase
VWSDGERVANVTTHPAFKNVIDALARIYDLQNSPQYRDAMTCRDPERGRCVSVSWLLPCSGENHNCRL